MKRVWHLFRKDLARVKTFAAALLLLVALRPILGVIAIAQDDISYRESTRLENIDTGLLIAHVVGAWLLALWLALLDSPRRPDAYLHTRPISRRTLWSAKLLGALALCVFAPLLAWLPWWIGCGIAGPDLRALVACHVGGLLLIVIPALTVGALVRDFRRAILASVFVAIVAVCLPVLLTVPGESRWRPFTDRDWVLRFDLWLLFGFSVVLTLLCLLYRRHPRWTGFVAWAAAAFALGIVLHQSTRPAPFPPPPPRDPLANAPAVAQPDRKADAPAWDEQNAADFADLRVELASLRRDVFSNDGSPFYVLTASATGTAGLLPQVEIKPLTFTSPNGDSVRFKHEALVADLYADMTRFITPAKPTQATASGVEKLTCYLPGPQAVRLDTLAGPWTVRADLRITLLRPDFSWRHPVAPGGWRHAPNGTGYRIASVREATEGSPGLELQTVETAFDSSGIWVLWQSLEGRRRVDDNRTRVFDAQGHEIWKHDIRGGTRHTVAGVNVRNPTYLLQLPATKGPDGKWTHPGPTPEWLAGLSYADVNLVPVARVTRQLTADDVAVIRQD